MATTHKVVKGDTLWDIAAKYLGSGTKYKQLATINKISSPYTIYIGQVIKLTSSSSSSSSSGSGSSGSSSKKKTSTNSNKATIDHFGLQSNADNVLFAAWTWSKSNTDSYKILWSYATGDGIWFVGSETTISVDKDSPQTARQSTYSIPSNAKKVRFKVKPISKTYTKNKKETKYWEASWSDYKYHTVVNPPTTPSAPTVTIDKYKLTAELDNVATDTKSIKFQIVKDNSSKTYKTITANVTSRHASCSCTVAAGGEYKVRCRAYKNDVYSEWSDYSNNVGTIPSAPSSITSIRGSSETSVYLEWSAVKTADTYEIEYTTKKEYFDGSDKTTTQSGIESNHFEKTGLESGTEYFFRVRAVNENGSSSWSEVKSVVVGKDPAAPTTWSSTTTVIAGKTLTLYWVHNSEDGSSETYAELELIIDGVKETYTIKKSTDDDEKDKTGMYVIDTTEYSEGVKIQWRVRTAGITKAYGDWSIQRVVDVYAPPTLEFNITDQNGDAVSTVDSFPFYFSALAGPNTQAPIGYHLTITSNAMYETVDNLGNERTVNVGEQVYSKYFDISDELLVEMSAGNIDLENAVEYTATCIVSMDSGLTAEESTIFDVAWVDAEYSPNAEISIDEDTITTSIRPYCEDGYIAYYKVTYYYGVYTVTDEVIDEIVGEVIADKRTNTGELVYTGMTEDGTEIYYCMREEKTIVEDVFLSVYRREFDGKFTEIAANLDGSQYTTVTDPHPALDYARYRIVAISKDTGSVSYYDLPGYPVNCESVIIQWDEEWTNFETSEESALEQPPWSGSMLKLPYNIDVSNSNKSDVTHVEYIGREHPIGYYGTQLGETATWNVAIEKSDKETLYALRRLSKWMGDVYVREPSGSGYWATISVSFSQKHCEMTIPVTLDITRVEGGA